MNTLADLSIGQRALISRVEGNDAVSIRLMEMGLIPGVELAVVGTAPLGDPLELEVLGYRLSVRRSEAERIVLGPDCGQ